MQNQNIQGMQARSDYSYQNHPKSVTEIDSPLAPVGQGFAALLSQREQLERYTESLEHRLSPVLQGELRNGQDGDKNPHPNPPMSPVKAQLLTEADRIRGINERLSSILDRLEL